MMLKPRITVADVPAPCDWAATAPAGNFMVTMSATWVRIEPRSRSATGTPACPRAEWTRTRSTRRISRLRPIGAPRSPGADSNGLTIQLTARDFGE